MDRFYVVANPQKDKDGIYSKKIKDYINNLGRSCGIYTINAEKNKKIYTDSTAIPKDVECVIVLGGDGTLIQAADNLLNLDVPLLGVNIGTLGYLADTDMEHVFSTIDLLVKDEYLIDERMMLTGTIPRDNKVLCQKTALNDVVINRNGILSIMEFDVYVNNKYLTTYNADGVIISTATGSTAYSLSAGGPIIQPTAKLLLMTPICPHSLNSRSIIFDEDDMVSIVIKDSKKLNEKRIVTFDGEHFFEVVSGDVINICKAKEVSKFIKTNKASFLERIRNKL